MPRQLPHHAGIGGGRKLKIDKWLNSRWFVKIVAFFLALMLWTVVNMGTTTTPPKPTGILPKVSQEIEALSNVPLKVYYNEDKFVISEIPQNVNVYVEGTNGAITAMKAQAGYEVFLDLQNLSPGSHRVQVQHRGFSEKLTVRTEPAYINVTINEKIEQIMPVKIEKLNEDKLPDGYIAEEPITVPNSVTIRGSMDEVQKIGFVEGYVDINGATTTVEKNIPLNVYGLNGDQLNLEIDPAVVEVKVPIIPPNKKVPFKINRKGSLPQGLSIQSFEITPSEITVYGPKEKIEPIELIDNIDVDLSTINEDQTLEIKVPVPEGATKVNPEVLTIKVDVEQEQSKTLTGVPIKMNGANEINAALIAPEDGLINLTVYGASKVLENIDPSDFDVRLNVGGYSEGEYELDIEVVSGPQDIRWELNPSKALVKIGNE